MPLRLHTITKYGHQSRSGPLSLSVSPEDAIALNIFFAALLKRHKVLSVRQLRISLLHPRFQQINKRTIVRSSFLHTIVSVPSFFFRAAHVNSMAAESAATIRKGIR